MMIFSKNTRVSSVFLLVSRMLAAGFLVSVAACSVTDVTSSTSDTVDAATPDVTLNHFIDVRLASIKQEAAVGHGENLDALAQMLGKEDKIAFGAWMQLNYNSLFTDLEKPRDLVSRIEQTIPRT